MSRLPYVTGLLLIAAAASASDLWPVDLRLTALLTPESEPVEATYRYDAGGGARVDGPSLQRGWRVEAGLVTRLVELSPRTALVGGGWVFYGDQESSGGAADAGGMTAARSYLVLGIDAYLAWRLQMTHQLGLEVGPVVGAGTTRFTDHRATADGSVEETGHGVYQEVGMNLQLLLRNPTHSVFVALGARYLVSYGEADHRFAGQQQEVEVTHQGLAPFASLGMTF